MKKEINTEDVLNEFFTTPEAPESMREDSKPITKVNTPKKKEPPKKAYSIMLKLDTDLLEFFNNITWITRDTKKDYVNKLIRADLLKRIGATERDSEATINTKWIEYINKLNDVLDNM